MSSTLISRYPWKELVQKYAEVKAANASLEQERLHAASSTNNRDSEVMALRLKLENMERSSSDYKVFCPLR